MFLNTLINITIVSIAVSMHYECLNFLSKKLPGSAKQPRTRIILGVLGALIAHSLEIWMFALAYFFVLSSNLGGSLQGAFDGTLLSCVYFSFTSYTTLGIGDIYPTGSLRFLAGIEGLVGLVLIAWTASFLYLEMERLWKQPTTINNNNPE